MDEADLAFDSERVISCRRWQRSAGAMNACSR